MSKKYHPIYLLHVLFILALWGILFFSMFRYPHDLRSLPDARLFFGLTILGGLVAAVAFVFLRLGALAKDASAMYRRTAVGDGILLIAAVILGAAFWWAREQTLFLCAVLGSLVLLQTHVPLPEDEEFDPPEFKDHVPPAGQEPRGES